MNKPRTERPKKVKDLTFELISPVDSPEMYAQLRTIIDDVPMHAEIREARIALAWCTSWKPDVDGHVTLGKCKKASDLDRELAPFDFVILLNRNFWEDTRVDDHARHSILDHELSHGALKRDKKTNLPEYDARGRLMYRIRKHDLEEFFGVAERRGCYKRDIEAFYAAVERGKAKANGREYIGPHRVADALRLVSGLMIAVETIAEWDDPERRAAYEWAEIERARAKNHSELQPDAIPPPPHVLTALNDAASTLGHIQ